METSPAVEIEPAQSVVVGIDGSDDAEHALAWAVHKTKRLGQVSPVSAYQLPITFDVLTKPGVGADLALYRAAAEARLAKAVATTTDPSLADRTKVIEAHPGVGLCEAASHADLLVVGTRGRSSLSAALLGSVSSYCVKHSTVPVAVIPEAFPTDRPLLNILVGVDGSENSEAALRWALDHAASDGRVLAVGALSVWGYMAGEFDPPPEVLEKKIRETVELTVERVKDQRYAGPEVEIRVVQRDPRVALRKLADAETDLLVLGARGVSGVPYLVLGSVSAALVHHPKVPTVIIPAPSASQEAV